MWPLQFREISGSFVGPPARPRAFGVGIIHPIVGCISFDVSIGADILPEMTDNMAAVFLVEEVPIIAKPYTPRSGWTRWLGSVVIGEGKDKF